MLTLPSNTLDSSAMCSPAQKRQSVRHMHSLTLIKGCSGHLHLDGLVRRSIENDG